LAKDHVPILTVHLIRAGQSPGCGIKSNGTGHTGTVNDPANRTTHELDVIAFGLDDDDRQRLLAIGEATWGETMGLPHLNRLRHLRDLLSAQGRQGAAQAKLACYSGSGFTDDLHRAADQDDSIVLVTLDDIYHLVA